MPAANRLYKVTLGDDIYVVEASTQQRAAAIVHDLHMTVEVLSAIEAVNLVEMGAKVLKHQDPAADPAE